MPSSAKDRFTVDWEYILFFSKKKTYYFEQQFEARERTGKCGWDKQGATKEYVEAINKQNPTYRNGGFNIGGTNRNKRCIWQINTQPFPEAHFAVFPEELCLTPIKAGCPEFVCVKCGKPKRKIIKCGNNPNAFNIRVRDVKFDRISYFDRKASKEEIENYKEKYYCSPENKRIISEGCSCNAGFEAGIVLDPFIGSGTVGLVAEKLQRKWIGIDLNEKYLEIAKKRIQIEADQLKIDWRNDGTI